jgi:hypothetical protein
MNNYVLKTFLFASIGRRSKNIDTCAGLTVATRNMIVKTFKSDRAAEAPFLSKDFYCILFYAAKRFHDVALFVQENNFRFTIIVYK